MESSSLADWTRGLSTGHAGKLGGDPGTTGTPVIFHKVLTLQVRVHISPLVHLQGGTLAGVCRVRGVLILT